MAQTEELEQIRKWLIEEGLSPESSREAQLGFLWRSFLHARSCLDGVTKELETNRLQHFAETAEVRKSLEQIKIFTGQKDVLAQEIQDENEELRKQLMHLVSLQDAQINEVAKMLYQQGLTELIHSTPSEQVAYLLVERASLLEMNQDPGEQTCDGDPERTQAEPLNPSNSSSSHKRAPRHLQNSWKKIFGLHKTSQTKHAFVPGGETLLPGQARRLEKECSRLERDVEEGSRRLAMAHNEIRRLKDELESANFTQKAYEPELQSAQEEVEHLRKEVEKLKQYEMAELRKAKELNDRLDQEIRALRNRVRSLDTEKNSLKKKVASQQEEVERLKSTLQGQQCLLTREVEVDQDKEKEKVQHEGAEMTEDDKSYIFLQKQLTEKTQQPMEDNKGSVESLQEAVEKLKLAVQSIQGTYKVQTCQDHELTKMFLQFKTTDVIQDNETCKDEKNYQTFHANHLLQRQSELLENYHGNMSSLTAAKETGSLLEFTRRTKEVLTPPLTETMTYKEYCGSLDAREAPLYDQDECEALKEQICEALRSIDVERSKHQLSREKLLEKLCRAKQKLDDETIWRDNRIKNLERELSLCFHSLKKEKEVVECITMENEKLLSEKRKLLQQLSEEEENMKNIRLKACLSKIRLEYLEKENKNLGNKVLQMSKQISILEHKLQKKQFLHFAEELKKMSTPQQKLTPLSVHTARLMLSDVQDLLSPPQSCDTEQADLTPFSGCTPAGLSQTVELGYLNLTSTQSLSNKSNPQI